MAHTAFGALQPEQKKLWVRESYRVFREAFFFTKFLGKDSNSIVQHITELKRTEKGDRALIGLVADMRGTGIVGDNELKGREESLESAWVEIHTDQLRNGAKSKGRVDDQRSVYDFRTEARDKLAFWRAETMEEFLLLAASGVSFAYRPDGSIRQCGAQDDPLGLEYAADVRAPSDGRHLYFDGSDLKQGDTTAITSACVPRYGMIVDAMAEARTRGVKPVRINGQDCFAYLCHPKTFAALKKDPDFSRAIIGAGERGAKNPVFTGATVTMDGLVIHTNIRAFNTLGADTGDKWGADGKVNGTRSLLLGAQALGFADIWGSSTWYEGKDDHDNKDVISIAMYTGVLKPQFKSRYDGDTVQDFGVMAIDLAL